MSSKIATFQDLQNMGAVFNTSPSSWSMCSTKNSALSMTDNVALYGSYENNQLIGVSEIGIINPGYITVDWSASAPGFTHEWLAIGDYVFMDAVDAGYMYQVYQIPTAEFGTKYLMMYYYDTSASNFITAYDSYLNYIFNTPAVFNNATELLFYGTWAGTPDAQIRIYT